MTNASTLVVTLAAVPAAVTAAYVQLYALEGKMWKFDQKIPFVGLTSTMAINGSGYYAFNIVFEAPPGGSTDAAIGFTANYGLTGALYNMVWAHKAAPQISDFKENVDTFTVLACAGMYTNVASPLNRQGKIVTRELPAVSNWENFLDFDTTANASLAVVMDAPTGAYAFTRPLGDSMFELKTLQYDNYDLPDEEFLFDLFPKEPYLLIHASIAITAGQDAYFTRWISLEYTSLSMFINQKVGTITEDELKTALYLLSRVPQVHENPLHFSDIWDWIKNTAKDVWGAVKEVAPVAMAVAPLLL